MPAVTYVSDQSAAAVHDSLRQSLAALEEARQCAVLWFEEVMPFWWIIQKLVFVIGGMFIPIDFYPDWLQGFAKYTPFAFAAYWPATTFVDFGFTRVVTTITGQLIYITIFGCCAALLFRAAVRKLHAQGG